MFGYRRKEDVVAAEGVLKELSKKYKNEVQNVPITVEAEVFREKPVKVTVSDGRNTVTVTGEIPENAFNRETEPEDIKKQLSKTGGTPYYIKKIEVGVDSGISYPLSSLNALRRSAIEALTEKRT
jgi:putative protease